MDNQTLVLCSLRDKLLNPSVLPKIPQIVGAFQGAVQTDLSLEQLTQLACLLPHIEREDLLFASFPQDMLQPSRVYSEALKNETFVLDVDNAEIRSYVEKFLDGSWPTEPKEPTCP
jgi:anionic cell wall polymer biosynthesis LytR-Cps2A-Psr (LCP) family protein